MIICLIVILLIVLLLSINVDCKIEFKYDGGKEFNYWLRVGIVKFKAGEAASAKSEVRSDQFEVTSEKFEGRSSKGEVTSKKGITWYISLFPKFKDDVNWLINYIVTKLVLIKDLRFAWAIGTGDAALTGQVCGVACSTVYGLIAVLNNAGRVQKQNVEIEPDFENEILKIDFSALLRARVYRIIRIGVRVIKVYFKFKKESPRH